MVPPQSVRLIRNPDPDGPIEVTTPPARSLEVIRVQVSRGGEVDKKKGWER